MTAGMQCDNCRKFGSSRAPRWFYLHQVPGDDEEPHSLLGALFGHPSEPLTFCTVRCLSEFATARALIEGQAAPEGPFS